MTDRCCIINIINSFTLLENVYFVLIGTNFKQDTALNGRRYLFEKSTMMYHIRSRMETV